MDDEKNADSFCRIFLSTTAVPFRKAMIQNYHYSTPPPIINRRPANIFETPHLNPARRLRFYYINVNTIIYSHKKVIPWQH
ncbi:MAG: hypothetical protein DI535_01675 [Citrobacter freundii]|nr:MAG: hypothetical protein DI535_01675 [Citrobacter freundii]